MKERIWKVIFWFWVSAGVIALLLVLVLRSVPVYREHGWASPNGSYTATISEPMQSQDGPLFDIRVVEEATGRELYLVSVDRHPLIGENDRHSGEYTVEWSDDNSSFIVRMEEHDLMTVHVPTP